MFALLRLVIETFFKKYKHFKATKKGNETSKRAAPRRTSISRPPQLRASTKVEGAKQGSGHGPATCDASVQVPRRTAHVAPPASRRDPKEAARLLTSSPGAAASTSFHFAGVVGANGSRVLVSDPSRPGLLARAFIRGLQWWAPGKGFAGWGLGRVRRQGVDLGSPGMEGSEDHVAPGRERRHERGYKLGVGLHSFPSTAGQLSVAASAQRSWRCAAAFTFSHCWGREEGKSNEVIWGLRSKALFLLSVASNLGLSPPNAISSLECQRRRVEQTSFLMNKFQAFNFRL